MTKRKKTAQEYALKLNVPLLYLVDNTITSIDDVSRNASHSIKNPIITSTEQDLLKKYRHLSVSGKKTVDAVLEIQYQASISNLVNIDVSKKDKGCQSVGLVVENQTSYNTK